MKDVVIFDFGTSKIKILVYKFSDKREKVAKLTFANASIGKLLNGTTVDADEKSRILEDFEEKTVSLLETFRDKNREIIAMATEVFRRNKELADILVKIQRRFGIGLEIVTPERECAILAANFDLSERDIVLDVGGGSANTTSQIGDTLSSHSYPLGAYALYNLFQGSGEKFDEVVYSNMDRYVRSIIEPDRQAYAGKFSHLILCSNQMLSFFSSLSEITGLNFMGDSFFDPSILGTVIDGLFLNKNYEEIVQYFPENPEFMHGADKMLVVLKNFVDITEAKSISPKNDGISSGLAKMFGSR
jgi:hypothetical protein